MNKVFKSLQARQIASKAIDTNIIYNDLHTKYGLGSINSILTPEHLGYQDKLNTEFDSKFVSSNKELIKSAFTQPISIVTLDRYYLKDMSTSISGQLNRAGIDNNVVIASDEDLQNKYIRPKNYDILLFGQNIGGDSDLYSFLHSSQAGQEGLNLSNYKSTEMDRLLEQVRGSKDIDAKIDKVTKVLLLWQKDIPAKVVARKQYQYFQSVKIEGGVYKYMSAPYQRFADILSWKISK
jgi:ABC-type transport system substrate-binding protein